MPSFDHEAILELFRRRPTLAAELARDELRLPVPGHVQVADSNMTEVAPTERSADLVLLFSDLAGGPPRRAIIVEAQLAIDADKRRSWWWYLVGVHTRHRCDVVLVIVTPIPAVAAWARRPLTLGHPGASLTPIVIGPDAVPVVTDAAEARLAPELAVLSAMMHGHGDAAIDIGKAVFAAVRDLDEDRAALYTDVVFRVVHAAARAILEGLMASGAYEYKSDFALRYVAKGREEGRQEGRQEGRGEGEARGRALAVLAFLSARGLEAAPELRQRVLTCTDLATLDGWITRAANAHALVDVFGE